MTNKVANFGEIYLLFMPVIKYLQKQGKNRAKNRGKKQTQETPLMVLLVLVVDVCSSIDVTSIGSIGIGINLKW